MNAALPHGTWPSRCRRRERRPRRRHRPSRSRRRRPLARPRIPLRHEPGPCPAQMRSRRQGWSWHRARRRLRGQRQARVELPREVHPRNCHAYRRPRAASLRQLRLLNHEAGRPTARSHTACHDTPWTATAQAPVLHCAREPGLLRPGHGHLLDPHRLRSLRRLCPPSKPGAQHTTDSTHNMPLVLRRSVRPPLRRLRACLELGHRRPWRPRGLEHASLARDRGR
mmetsp:Transcript_72406/g.200739  ORF Transcript_72406/g.200739 Transcript_72406/m.200739 type:complete len:225 (-) Transcript_72406:273-947(-)